MFWNYINPVEIIFGNGALPALAEHTIGKNIMLVTDRYWASTDMPAFIEKMPGKKAFVLFGEVESNPSTETVNRCGHLARENNVDIIIGLGGGSSLDTAKASALVASSGFDIELYLGGEIKIDRISIPVIAVPTTAGTGSEVTPVAVITWNEKKKKQPLAGKSLFPKVALVDPELTYSMPAYVTASTGIDALAHGMEAYWSKQALPVTDGFAIGCVARTMKFLKRAVKNGLDREARREMALASLLGGLAFALPKTAAVHACSFPLTSHFNIPHGVACGLTLSPFVEFNYPVMSAKMDILFRYCGFDSLPSFLKTIDILLKEIALPVRLSACGIQAKDIDFLIKESFHPNIQNNPREVTAEALRDIYRRIL
ncbi:MAG: iron-containing alcohol dehydrogenase [Verrucomicrobiota bacterium]